MKPFGYDTLEEASAVVRCGEKYLYIPRNISRKAFLYDKIKETIIHYFLDTDAPDYISMLEYSTGDTCRDAVAVAEFCDFGNENAKSHIKQRIRRILPKLLNEKNEKCITKLIMADTEKNYKNFSCKVVRINPLKAAGAKASAAFCGLTDTGNFASCFLFYKNPAY